MKRIAMFLFIILMSISAFAQYQAGNILVTGTLIFDGSQSKTSNGGTTVNGPKTTKFEIGPGLEYFFTNNISIGADIDFSFSKTDDKNPGGGADESIDKTSMTTITPFASMYFINEEKFGLFCKLGIGFGFGKTDNETRIGNVTATNETKLSSFEVGISPGVAVHLSDKFGMNATIGWLGYSSTKSKRNNVEDKTSKYGLELVPSLGFGLFYKLK